MTLWVKLCKATMRYHKDRVVRSKVAAHYVISVVWNAGKVVAARVRFKCCGTLTKTEAGNPTLTTGKECIWRGQCILPHLLVKFYY